MIDTITVVGYPWTPAEAAAMLHTRLRLVGSSGAPNQHACVAYAFNIVQLPLGGEGKETPLARTLTVVCFN